VCGVRSVDPKILSVADAEYFARKRLPKSLAMEIEAGAPVPTFGRNLAAFSDIRFVPRTGLAFPSRELATTLLGHRIAFPLLVAPTGNIRVLHRDAELGAARAAGAAGTIYCVSAFMGHPIEDVVAATPGPVFFQLYFVGGRANAEAMIHRAARAGCAGLILTLDTTGATQAERGVQDRAFLPSSKDLRSAVRFLPQALRRPAWLLDFMRDGMVVDAPMALSQDGRPMSFSDAFTRMAADMPLVWEDIKWIRELWSGPLIVKGLLSPEDARRAVAEGAAALVVSNHGGHLLPGTLPSLHALPRILDAVGHEVEVMLDSGVRRGADVVKALALGARAVLIGRGYLWAHAAAGEAGVRRILDVFRTGIDQTLALIGCPSVADLNESFIDFPASWREPRTAGTAPGLDSRSR